jgi:hypothetical protein
LISSHADGSSAVAAIVDTSAAWSNAASKLLSLRTNGVEQLYISSPNSAASVIHSNGGGLTISDEYTDSIVLSGGSSSIFAAGYEVISCAYTATTFFSSNTQIATIGATGISPVTDNAYTNGDSTHRWSNVSAIQVQIGTATVLPSPSSTTRGSIYILQGTTGVADIAYICIKGSDNSYSWKVIGLS